VSCNTAPQTALRSERGWGFAPVVRAFVADVPAEILAGSPVILETTLPPLHRGVSDKFLMSPVPGRGGSASEGRSRESPTGGLSRGPGSNRRSGTRG
jgi:hypothetical protein